MIEIVIGVLGLFVIYRTTKQPADAPILLGPFVIGGALGGCLAYYDVFLERTFWEYGALTGAFVGLIVAMILVQRRDTARKDAEAATHPSPKAETE